MGGRSARVGKTRPDKPWRRPGAVRYALRRVPGLLRPPVDVYEPESGSLTMLKDLPVTVRDGTTLRVNVVLPAGQGPFPALLSAHPYGKDNLPRRGRTGYRVSVQYRMLRQPARVRFSSLTGWEAPDPAWWAGQGYAVVNCDLRGAGTSEGTCAIWSDQEGEDVYDLIEWAAAQPWSTGAIGMLGVSYLAISQWKAAALRPPSLKAICPWEGFTDAYRDLALPWRHRRERLHQDVRPRAARGAAALQAHRGATPPPAARPLVARAGPRTPRDQRSGPDLRQLLRQQPAWPRLVPRLGAHRERRQVPVHPSRRQVAHVLLPRSQRRPARVLRPLPARPGRPRPPRIRLEVRESRDVVRSVRDEQNWPLDATEWRSLYLTGDGLAGAPPPRTASSPSAPGPAAPAGNGPSPPTRRSPGRWRCGSGWRHTAPMTSACSRVWRSGAGGATCRSRGRTGSAGTGSRPAG